MRKLSRILAMAVLVMAAIILPLGISTTKVFALAKNMLTAELTI